MATTTLRGAAALACVAHPSDFLTLRKLECFKRVEPLNTQAWDNAAELQPILLVPLVAGRINRNGWGHLYLAARGEILGFVKDKRRQKHLPKMFSLIKNES